MGRQINFYMSNEVKIQFYEFLKNDGFLFLPTSGFEVFDDTIMREEVDINNEYFICLYKKFYGEIITRKIEGYKKQYINIMYNPVIQFKIPQVDDIEKKILNGRIWLTSYDFHDKNASRKAITSDYNRLVRWIKKNVPYQECEIKGVFSSGFFKEYINDDIVLKMAEQGYHIG